MMIVRIFVAEETLATLHVTNWKSLKICKFCWGNFV